MSNELTIARRIPRAKRLRGLGYLLGFLIALYWLIWCFPSFGNESSITQLNESEIAFRFVYSGFLLIVCAGLYLGHEWAWWVGFLGLMTPAALVALRSDPILSSFSGIAFIAMIHFFFQSHPWIDRLSPDLVNDIDAIATSLGLRWDEQPLWQLVQRADSGYASEAVKQYRETHGVSWDEADHAVKRWIGNEEGLKAHLLRQHVEALSNIGKQN